VEGRRNVNKKKSAGDVFGDRSKKKSAGDIG